MSGDREKRRVLARLGWRPAHTASLLALASGLLGHPLHADGIPVGKWVFYPSVEAVWQTEDNLFLLPDDPESASTYVLQPRLRWELPFRESSVKVKYEPLVRRFSGDVENQGLGDRYHSHFADLEAKLGFSSGFRLRVHDNLVRDRFDTVNFDPGGEVPFNSTPYTRNRFEAEAVKQVGVRHGVGVSYRHDALDFDEGADVRFLNFASSRGGLLYEFRVSPLAQYRVAYWLGNGDQDRPPVSGTEVSDRYDTREVLLSYLGPVGKTGKLELRTGYIAWNFDNPDSKDFSGISAEVRHHMRIIPGLTLLTTLVRYPYQSFFDENTYYLSHAIDCTLAQDGGSHLFYSVNAAYRINDYPEEISPNVPLFVGEHREDRVVRGGFGVGYRFSDSLNAELRYRRETRGSTLETLDYTSNRISLQLSFGLR